MIVEDILARFENSRPSGKGFKVRCPSHDDRTNSLSVCEGNNGKILIKCMAAGFIRPPASHVKEKKKRNVPISAELQIVLNELKAEQKKAANISDRVFTRNGRPMKSIRTAFEEARDQANIEDLHLHDFRHTCITRWATMGIPQQAIMAATGHHSIQQSNAYVNMKDEHLKMAFESYTPVIQEKPLDAASNASY